MKNLWQSRNSMFPTKQIDLATTNAKENRMTQKSNQGNQRLLWKNLLPFILLCGMLMGTLTIYGQGGEHQKHHPSQTSLASSGSGSKGSGGGMGGKKGGGMMGGKGGGMGGMMKKMGAPKPKELYPQLMDLPDLPLEKRIEIKEQAHQRMIEGTQLFSKGLDELAISEETDDFQAMQEATAKMREGLAQFESGLAAHRALEEGKAPRNIALQWFQRKMNLLPSAAAKPGWRFFGMTFFHTSIMFLMAGFTAAMSWMYFFKMRRATELLQKLTTSEATPIITTAPIAAASTSAVASPKPSKKTSNLATNSNVPADDCCQESSVECADEANMTDRLDISKGVLHIAKRKLCKMRVARIYQETVDVKTFRLVACHGGGLPFSYYPGQFLTLTLPTGEKSIKRSYTISSSPTQGYYCEITVKREEKGAGSRYLHDILKEGETLEVRAPSGKFIFTGQEADNIALIGGGVGITPMMSITRALTDMEWKGEIYFIVACRDPEHFIFASELKRLQKQHSNLHLHVAMSRIKKEIEGYHRGRISQKLLAQWIPDIASQRIHICGAPPMMDSTKEMLKELNVPAESIFSENFGSQKKPRAQQAKPKQNVETPKKEAQANGTVTFEISKKSTELLPDETILEASERVDVDIDSSCRTGMCGICVVKLLSGEVSMEVEDGLEPEEKAGGMILACQAQSTGNVSVEA